MLNQTSLEIPANVGVSQLVEKQKVRPEYRLSQLAPMYLRYAQYDLNLSPQTVSKYKECLGHIVRDMEDVAIEEISLGHVTVLKQKIITRGAGESRVYSMVYALKALLKYSQEVLELNVIDYRKIKNPRLRRREVVYLTNEEVRQFVDSIKLERKWNGKKQGKFIRLDGIRFRTLVEVLLGTGMRISEALQLDRDSIDLAKKEAKIIGKGRKERTVFFSDRALQWIRFYLEARSDNEKPLFLTNQKSRLKREDISFLFKRYTVKAGINKKITPHILRHTVATNLLFNGCPISHVKEILGHERLETTCKYYLGVDKSKAKEAHSTFLSF